MKKTTTALTALVLSAMLTAPALAEEEILLIAPNPNSEAAVELAAEAAEETEAEEHKVSYPKLEGYDFAVITSSYIAEGGDTTPMVDGLSDTAVTVTADGAEKTLSVYVTSYAPYELSAIAGMFGDVVPTVRVFGSNDYALAEWKEIRLSKNAVDNEGFTTIKTVDMDITKTEEYRFFRVDMTIAEGEFSVAELVMYRPEGKMLIPVYAEGDGLSVDAEIIGYKEPGSEEIVQLPKKPAVVRKPFEIRLRPTAKPYKVEKLSK